ncbi:MAG: hypothetical protein F4X00_06395 [Gemmatimonadetes bacterium]|nr:hypothetical protein [Gemmatimonadota bacterium]
MEPPHNPPTLTATDRLRPWIAQWIGANWLWHAKFLSGTETSATQAHRPGPCVPRHLLTPAFSSLTDDVTPTPVEFDIEIDSHGFHEAQVRAVPHTGKGLFGAPLPEFRLTNLSPSSPLRDHENTGALAIFAFRPGPGPASPNCRLWICRNPDETDVANDLIGPVEPGFPAPWGPP